MDDLAEYDPDLSDGVVENCRRYTSLFGDAVYDCLPDYKEKEVDSMVHLLHLSTLNLDASLIFVVYPLSTGPVKRESKENANQGSIIQFRLYRTNSVL